MLAAILNAPRMALDWQRWGLHHKTSHDLIRRAINSQTKGSTNLPDYIGLYPIDVSTQQNARYFLEYNQSAHTDMNAVLGAQSINLLDIDLGDERQLAAWIYLHWQEHNTAEKRLGIGS